MLGLTKATSNWVIFVYSSLYDFVLVASATMQNINIGIAQMISMAVSPQRKPRPSPARSSPDVVWCVARSKTSIISQSVHGAVQIIIASLLKLYIYVSPSVCCRYCITAIIN